MYSKTFSGVLLVRIEPPTPCAPQALLQLAMDFPGVS